MLALQSWGRKLLSLALPVLLAGTPVVVPTLDRDLLRDGPVVEAEHDPATCVVGHDHTLCSQVGANRWVPAKPTAPWFSLREDAPPSARERHVPSIALRSGSCHPRAPPPG